MLLYPLPGVEHRSDLVAIASQTRDGAFVNLSYPDYRDYRDIARTLDGVVVTETTTLSLGAISEAERAERLYGALVLAIISVSLAFGRRSDGRSAPTTIARPAAARSC